MRSGRSSRPVSWLLLVPFLLLAMLPGGVMPRVSAQGIVLVLCTGDGMLELRVDPRTGEPVQDSEAQDRHCPWAQMRVTDALIAAPVLPAPAITEARLLELVLPVLRRVIAATGLPPATGPPLDA